MNILRNKWTNKWMPYCRNKQMNMKNSDINNNLIKKYIKWCVNKLESEQINSWIGMNWRINKLIQKWTHRKWTQTSCRWI